MQVYLNGQIVSDAKISVFDEGLLYGHGVYETLRAYSGSAFRQNEHIRRLQKSATEVGLEVPNADAVKKAIDQTIQVNRLQEGAIRVVLTAGSQSDWGNAPQSLIVMAKPIEAVPKTFKAVTVPFHRDVAKAKTLNCLTSVMARRHAKAHQADEAIFTLNGNVLEGTNSNVFAVKKGELLTPKKNVLEGITRNAVLELAEKEGLYVREEPIPVEELYQADEAFLTSTLKELVPICVVDGKEIPSGKITRQLQNAYTLMVRHEIQNQK